MADPLTKFGLSRRPASELFGPSAQRFRPLDVYDVEGVPDFSRPGWATDKAVRAAADRQALIDEEMALENERAALEDERIARERQREAEAVADEFTRIKEPSAREKFFDENEATIAGSKRYNQLAEMRQRQPSFADNVLAKNIANKIDDPDERNEFLQAVARGEGTFAAKDRSDRFRMRRGAVAALTKAGVHPTEANRIADEEGYSPEVINYHVAQQENESSFPKDLQAQALEKRYRVLKDRARTEESRNGSVSDETEAEMLRVSLLLDEKYKMIAEPPAPTAASAEGVVPRSERTSAPITAPANSEEAKAALRRKLGLVKS